MVYLNVVKFLSISLLIFLHPQLIKSQLFPSPINNHPLNFYSPDLQGKLSSILTTIKSEKLDFKFASVQSQLWQSLMGSANVKEFILGLKNGDLNLIKSGLFDGVENPQCVNDALQFYTEISESSLTNFPSVWALQMIDAWGKIPDGILSGHTSSPGDFQECLQIRATLEANANRTESEFKGQYCITYFLPNFDLLANVTLNEVMSTLRSIETGLTNESRASLSPQEMLMILLTQFWSFVLFPQRGICMPSSCSKDDIQMILLNLLPQELLVQSVSACYTDEKEDFDTAAICVIALLSLIGFLCLMGTIMDVFVYRRGEEGTFSRGILMKILVAFSVYTNTLKWANTDSGKDSLGCLHGLRFLSMAWVVLGHTWVMLLGNQFLWNTYDFVASSKDTLMLAILNGTPSVDTFFTIGGTLCAYNILRVLDKTKGRLNVPLIYFHRFLRLTPTYMILLGIMATLLPYAGSGPNWFVMEGVSKSCRKWWWHNLLYITNVVKLEEGESGCYGEAWYLSNDMQFFLLSPFILYPIWRWKRVGLTLLGLLHLASVLIPTIVKYTYELQPTLIISIAGGRYSELLYTKPWSRIAPYLVGLLLGYVLNLESKSHGFSGRRRVPKWVYLGWLICTFVALAVIFGVQRYFDSVNEVETNTSFWSAIYGGFHRYAWGWCIAWIVYACVNGYGGWVDDFLSWKPFIPLGRLTFCVYMASYHLQMLFHLTTLTPWHYSAYIGINIFMAHLVLSLLVGYVLTITLESPVMQLEKLIFPPPQPKSQLTFIKSESHVEPNGEASPPEVVGDTGNKNEA